MTPEPCSCPACSLVRSVEGKHGKEVAAEMAATILRIQTAAEKGVRLGVRAMNEMDAASAATAFLLAADMAMDLKVITEDPSLVSDAERFHTVFHRLREELVKTEGTIAVGIASVENFLRGSDNAHA